jgi:hypothetical protein
VNGAHHAQLFVRCMTDPGPTQTPVTGPAPMRTVTRGTPIARAATPEISKAQNERLRHD